MLMHPSGSNKKVLIIIVGLALLLGLGYFLFNYYVASNGEVACTLEAKLCPDGSYVGRTGPDCAFSACPSGVNNSNDWPTITDQVQQVTFKYPQTLEADYIFTQSWPPNITVENNQLQLDCAETEATNSSAIRVSRRIINDKAYCVKAESEGAAGSVYTNYRYSTLLYNRLINLDFSLRFTACSNYETDEQNQCAKEREDFNIDTVVDEVVGSLHFINDTVEADWQAVKTAIETCQVKFSMQTHALVVEVELKDGRTLTAIEPKIDEIFKVINSVKDKCGTFPMATE